MKTLYRIFALIIVLSVIASLAKAATTPTITWSSPQSINSGATLASVLNPTASVPGTFTYTDAGLTVTGATVPTTGTHTITATFTPTDTVNYTSATGTLMLYDLIVPTITWNLDATVLFSGVVIYNSPPSYAYPGSTSTAMPTLGAQLSGVSGSDGTFVYTNLSNGNSVVTDQTPMTVPGLNTLQFTFIPKSGANIYASVSTTRQVFVDQRPTLTSMSSNPSSVVVGQSANVSLTVADADSNLVATTILISGPQMTATGGTTYGVNSITGDNWYGGLTAIFAATNSNTANMTKTMTTLGTYYYAWEAQDIASWTLASAAVGSFTVVQATPSVSFTSVGSMGIGSVNLSASVVGGYNPTGSITYSVISQTGVSASITGNSLTLSSPTSLPGSVTVRATYPGDTNNVTAHTDQTISVIQTVPTISWSSPHSINAGTTLASVLTATCSTPGTIAYTESASSVNGTTVLSAGTHIITATFTPTDAVTYTSATSNSTVYVLSIPTITWNLDATVNNSGVLSIGNAPQSSYSGSTNSAMPTLGSVITSGATTLSASDGSIVYTDQTTGNSVINNGTPMTVPGWHTLKVTFTPTPGVNIYGSLTATAQIFVNQLPTLVSMPVVNLTTGTGTVIIAGQTVGIGEILADADGNMTQGGFLLSGPQVSNESVGQGTYGRNPVTSDYWGGYYFPTFTATTSKTTSWSKVMKIPGTYYATWQAYDLAGWCVLGYNQTPASFTVIAASPTVNFPVIANMDIGSSIAMTATTVGGYTPSGAITYSIVSTNGATAHVSGTNLVIDSRTGSPGTVTVRATYPGDISNNSAFADQVVTVKTMPTITWATPSAITYGTALSATQLNASASTAGSYTYTPSAGTVLAAGARTLSVHFVPSDTTNFSIPVDSTVNLTVNKAPLTVTANSPTVTYTGFVYAGTPGIVYSGFVNGDTSATLGGTMAYAFSPVSPKNVGTYTITPSGMTSSNYTFNYVAGTLTISKATLTVTANSPSATYTGAAYSGTPGVTYAGFLGTDTSAAVSGSPAYAYSPISPTNVGTYTITPSAGSLTASNYSFAYSTGTLTIGKAALTITANSPTVIYTGSAYSGTPGVTYSGFLGTDNSTVLGGTLAYAYSPLSPTVVGSYSITPSGATSTNYSLSYVNGSLTISKATPSITWSTPSAITYGTALSGTQLNASASTVGSYTYSPAAGAVLSVGTQTLTVHFVPSDTANYSTPSDATVSLTVNKAMPTLSWSNPAAITYGTTLSSTQLNATASVGGTYSYTPVAGSVLPAGSQVLSVHFVPSDTANFSTPADATVTLVVNKATPVVTWSNPADITYGTALSGTQLNATASVLGSYVYSPASGAILGAGNQTLSLNFAPTDSSNYNNVNGTTVSLLVGKATNTVSITPTSASVEYGQDVTFTVSGGTNHIVWGGVASGTGATATVTSPAVGTHTVTVIDNGDANHDASVQVSATITVTLRTDSIATITTSTVQVGSKITVPATTIYGVNVAYTITSNGIPVTGFWTGNVFTIARKNPGTNSTLDLVATSLGDSNNTPVGQTVHFPFPNHAPQALSNRVQ